MVSANLPYIVKHYSQSTFRATITKNTCHNLYNDIMYAAKMGFSTIFAIINEFEEWPEEYRNIVEGELRKYSLYVINCCMNNKPFIKLRTLEQAFNKIVAIDLRIAETPEDIDEIGPEEGKRCGMGSGYGSINYKGDIFSCQEVASRINEKSIFHIGNIYSGIDEEKLNSLRQAYLERPIKSYNKEDSSKCENCISKLTCSANVCPINNYILYKDFSATPDCWCWWTNTLIKESILIFHVLGNNKNEFFKDYLIDELTSLGGPMHYVYK